MSLHSRYLTLCFALALMTPLAARAQPPESCVIGARPPAFEAGDAGDRLHALPHPIRAAHTGLHGQLLYGNDTLYFSHLAVFMGKPDVHPHNFQVVLEVEFADQADKARYQADRLQHPDVFYTAVPPNFDQLALVVEHPGRTKLRNLADTRIDRGHFEQGGKTILNRSTLQIKRLVYFREFFLGGSKLARQSYLLFGRGDDMFVSHLLSAPPDFAQILSVRVEIEGFPGAPLGQPVASQLAQGLYLQLPGRENIVSTRVRKGESMTCHLETGTRANPIEVKLHFDMEYYCEVGEFTELVLDNFNKAERCSN